MGLIALLTGCGGNGVEAPKIDPKTLADAVLAEFDTNKDGAIDVKELERCPGLKRLAARLKHERLNSEDLVARFTTYVTYPDPVTPYYCQLQLDGKPLADATVTLVPEACMGSAYKPVIGKSDANGAVNVFQVEGARKPGVPHGLYRVRVAKEGAVPPKYGENTPLGVEIGPPISVSRGAVVPEDPLFRLTTR